jgi:hypothetical protein
MRTVKVRILPPQPIFSSRFIDRVGGVGCFYALSYTRASWLKGQLRDVVAEILDRKGSRNLALHSDVAHKRIPVREGKQHFIT